eukprot:7305312-Pyramimonas_sp.AAC.1
MPRNILKSGPAPEPPLLSSTHRYMHVARLMPANIQRPQTRRIATTVNGHMEMGGKSCDAGRCRVVAMYDVGNTMRWEDWSLPGRPRRRAFLCDSAPRSARNWRASWRRLPFGDMCLQGAQRPC